MADTLFLYGVPESMPLDFLKFDSQFFLKHRGKLYENSLYNFIGSN